MLLPSDAIRPTFLAVHQPKTLSCLLRFPHFCTLVSSPPSHCIVQASLLILAFPCYSAIFGACDILLSLTWCRKCRHSRWCPSVSASASEAVVCVSLLNHTACSGLQQKKIAFSSIMARCVSVHVLLDRCCCCLLPLLIVFTFPHHRHRGRDRTRLVGNHQFEPCPALQSHRSSACT